MRDRMIDLVNGALKDHFDYVPLDTAIKVADQLLAAGIIVPPPVKMGDTLFYVMKDGTIYSGQVYSLRWEFHEDYGIRSEVCARAGAYFTISASFDDFGKTVFFTKEEAEQSLKEG